MFEDNETEVWSKSKDRQWPKECGTERYNGRENTTQKTNDWANPEG